MGNWPAVIARVMSRGRQLPVSPLDAAIWPFFEPDTTIRVSQSYSRNELYEEASREHLAVGHHVRGVGKL